MAQRATQYLEQPARGNLPGTRPLSVEEYECLATTHPYAVKHLVTKKVAPGLCADAVKRLPATRLPTALDAANQVQAGKCCSAVGGGRQGSRFLLSDKEAVVRRSIAQGHVRTGAAKTQRMHTNGNVVDLQPYASPPYSTENHETRGFAQFVTGQVGEQQLVSNIAKFPTFDGSSTGRQGIQAVDCFSSGNSKDGRKLILHDCAAVTNPEHYHKDELWQARLSGFHSPVKRTRCPEQTLAYQRSFTRIDKTKSSCPIHHNGENSDSAIVPSLETDPTRQYECSLRDVLHSREYGRYGMARPSLVSGTGKSGVDPRTCGIKCSLPHCSKQETEDSQIHAKCFSEEHSTHDLRCGKCNSLSPTGGLLQQPGNNSPRKLKLHEVQDILHPSSAVMGSEAFPSGNAEAQSHAYQAYSHVRIGSTGMHDESLPNKQLLWRRQHLAGIGAEKRQTLTGNPRAASWAKPFAQGTYEPTVIQRVLQSFQKPSYLPQSATNASLGMWLERGDEIIGSTGRVGSASMHREPRRHAGESGCRRLGSTASSTGEDCRLSRDRESARGSGRMGSVGGSHKASADKERCSPGGHEEGSRQREVSGHLGEVQVSGSSKEMRSGRCGADASRDGGETSRSVKATEGGRGEQLREGGGTAEAGASRIFKGNDKVRRVTHPEEQTQLRSSVGSSMRNTAFTGTEPANSGEFVCTSSGGTGYRSSELKARSQQNADGRPPSERRGFAAGVSEGDMRRIGPNVSDQAMHVHQAASSASLDMGLKRGDEIIGSAGRACSASMHREPSRHVGESGCRRLGSTASSTGEDCRFSRDRESARGSGRMGSVGGSHKASADKERCSPGGHEEGSRQREVSGHLGEVQVSGSSKEVRSGRCGADASRDGGETSRSVKATEGGRGEQLREGGGTAEAGASRIFKGNDKVRRVTHPEEQTQLRSSVGSSMRNTAFTGTEPANSGEFVCTSSGGTGYRSSELKARSQQNADGRPPSERRGFAAGVSEGDMRRIGPNVSDQAMHVHQAASSASLDMRLKRGDEIIGSAGRACSASMHREPRRHAGESGCRRLGSTASSTGEDCRLSRDRESARGSGRMGSVGGSHKASADKERCSPGGHEEGSRQREVSGHLGEVQVSGSSKEMRSGRCGADASRDGGETSRSMKATEGGRGEQLREGGGTAEAGASRIFKGNDKARRVTHPEEQTQLRSSVGSSMRNTAFTGTEPANSGEFVCTSSGGTGYRSSELKARSQQNADGRPPSERRGFAAGVSEGDMRRIGPNVSDQAMHVHQAASSASLDMGLKRGDEIIGSAGRACSASMHREPRRHAGESGCRRLGSTASSTGEDCRFSRDRESARGSGRMGSVGGSHKASADKERCSPGGHEEGSRQREVSGHLGEVQVSGSSKEMRSERCGADASRDGGETSRPMKATEGGRGEQLREGGGTAEAGASRIFKGNDKVRRVTHPEEQTQLRSSVGSSMRNTAFTGTEPANSGEFVCTSSGGTGYRSSELKARSQQNADGRPPSERRGFAAGVSEGDMRRIGPNVSDQAMHVHQAASSASLDMRLKRGDEIIGSAGRACSASMHREPRRHAGESGCRRLGSTASSTGEDCRFSRDRESARGSGRMGSVGGSHKASADKERCSPGGHEEGSRQREVSGHLGEVQVSGSSKEMRSGRCGADASRDGGETSRSVKATEGGRGEQLREGGGTAEAGASRIFKGNDKARRVTHPEEKTELRSSVGSSMRNTAFTGTEPANSGEFVCTSSGGTGYRSSELKARSQQNADGRPPSERRGFAAGVSEGDMRRIGPNVSDQAMHVHQAASSASLDMRLKRGDEIIGSAGRACSASMHREPRRHAGESGCRRLGSTASSTGEDCRLSRDRESARGSGRMGSVGGSHKASADKERCSPGGHEEGSRQREVSGHLGEVQVSGSSKEMRSERCGADASRDGGETSRPMKATEGGRGEQLREGGGTAEAGASRIFKGNDKVRRVTHPEEQTQLRSSVGSSMRNTAFTGTEPANSGEFVCTSSGGTGYRSSELKARSQQNADGRPPSERRGFAAGVSEGDMRRVGPNVSDQAMHVHQAASSASLDMGLKRGDEIIGSAGRACSASMHREPRRHAGESGCRRLGSTASSTGEDCRFSRDRESARGSGRMGSVGGSHKASADKERCSPGGHEEGSRQREVSGHLGEVQVSGSSKEMRSGRCGADASRDGGETSRSMKATEGGRGEQLREGGGTAEAGASRIFKGNDKVRRVTHPEEQTQLRSSVGSSMRNTAFTGTEPANSGEFVCTSSGGTGYRSSELKVGSQPNAYGRPPSERRGFAAGVSEGDMRRVGPNVSDQAMHVHQAASSVSLDMRLKSGDEIIGSAGRACSASMHREPRRHAGESGCRRLGSTASSTGEDCRLSRDRESARGSGRMGSVGGSHKASADKERCSPGGHEEGSRQREVSGHLGEVQVSGSSKEMRSERCGADASRDGGETSRPMKATEGGRGEQLREGGGTAEAGASRIFKGNDKVRRVTHPEEQTQLRSSVGSSMRNTAFTGTEPANSGEFVCTSSGGTGYRSSELKARSQQNADGRPPSERRGFAAGVSEGDMRRVGPNVSDQAMHVHQAASSASLDMGLKRGDEIIGSAGRACSASMHREPRRHAGESGCRRLGSTASSTGEDCRFSRDRESARGSGRMGSVGGSHKASADKERCSPGGHEEGSRQREVSGHLGEVQVSGSSKEMRSGRCGADASRDGGETSRSMKATEGGRGEQLREGGGTAEAGASRIFKGNDKVRRVTHPEEQTQLRSSVGSSMRNTAFTGTEPANSGEFVCTSSGGTGYRSSELKVGSQPNAYGRPPSERRGFAAGVSEGDMRRVGPNVSDQAMHVHQAASSVSLDMRLKSGDEIIGSAGRACSASMHREPRRHAGESGCRRLGSTASSTGEDCRFSRDRESARGSGRMGSVGGSHKASADKERCSPGGHEEGSRQREVSGHLGEVQVSGSSKEMRSGRCGADASRDGGETSRSMKATEGGRGEQLREGGGTAEAGASRIFKGNDKVRRVTHPEEQTQLRSSVGSSMRNTAFTGTEPANSGEFVCTSSGGTGYRSSELKVRSQPNADGRPPSERRGFAAGVPEGDMRRIGPNVSDQAMHVHQAASSASLDMRLKRGDEIIGSAGRACSASMHREPRRHAGESGCRRLGSTASSTGEDCRLSRDRESARGSGRMGSVGGSHKASADKERCSPGGHEEGSRQREVSGHLGEVQVSGSSKEMRSGRCGADASRDGGETSRSMKATEGGRGEQLREGGGTAEAGASRIFKGNDKVRRVTHPEEQTQLRSSVGSSMRNTAFTGTEPANSGEFVCTSSGGTGYRSSELKVRSQPNADGRPPSERRGFAAGVPEGDMRRIGPNVSDQAMHVHQAASSVSLDMRLKRGDEIIGSAGRACSASMHREPRRHAGESGCRRLGSTASSTGEDCRLSRDRESARGSGRMGSVGGSHKASADKERCSPGGHEEGSRQREVSGHLGEVQVSGSSKEMRSGRCGADASRDGGETSRSMKATEGGRGEQLREGGGTAEAGASRIFKGNDKVRRLTRSEEQTHLRILDCPSVLSMGASEGGAADARVLSRNEDCLFQTCRSGSITQVSFRSKPLSTRPLESAQRYADPLVEEGSLKLSESTAFDKFAYCSPSCSGNLESVLQSAVSAKAPQNPKDGSGRDSMNRCQSKRGGDAPINSSQNITARELRHMPTPLNTQTASLENVKSGLHATALSEHTSVKQKHSSIFQDNAETAHALPQNQGTYNQEVAGRCNLIAHDRSGNRPSSSMPSLGSQKHGRTKLQNSSELKYSPSKRVTDDGGPDAPKWQLRSAQSRDSSSVVDRGKNISKQSLDPSSTFGNTTGFVSLRRRSTEDLHSDMVRNGDCLLPTNRARAHMEKPRINSAAPPTSIMRPSYMDATAVGRRLTAQNNMWSAVGSYEPLASLVFHELYPQLSRELQALCMQCLGTGDSSELRALTDIQQAAMKLVAEQSVRRSAEAKSRLVEVFKRTGQPIGTLESLEQFLLLRSPILIYFDIVSLTPHLEQGGFIRSHFEIPQTDATYLRKCNEREQALYCGLYEHESVRPEHHPKYGYVSVNCNLQPPWEPQPGEACIILKDHVRVRATISASQHDGSGVLSFGREPLVATLNNPWHVLEALGHEALSALAAFAAEPTSEKGGDISALVDCNIHGEIKLGKDVEAIVLPKSATRDKATFAKLREIATQHMVPILSMEKCPRAVKDDGWKHTLRHLQHKVLLKKTALGNTYGQI